MQERKGLLIPYTIVQMVEGKEELVASGTALTRRGIELRARKIAYNGNPAKAFDLFSVINSAPSLDALV